MQPENHHEEGAWTIQHRVLLQSGTCNDIVYSMHIIEDVCVVSSVTEE